MIVAIGVFLATVSFGVHGTPGIVLFIIGIFLALWAVRDR
jgi:hypothetical protein